MTARNLCLAATLVYSLAAIGAMAPGAAMAPGGGTAQAEPAQSTMITGILVNSDLGEGHYLLEARGNREITVNALHAIAAHRTAVLVEGRAYIVIGTLGASGELEATSIARAK